MDLSLTNNELVDGNGGSSSGLDHINRSGAISIEKEHMFDKVVTPSDVGKLNRLVIPKQHAEKYFPLDASSNEKGLLLNFEDRNGKPWRFRYSYWNSSQSYVMTKGWSRFVKEKKLDAGDIVSFQRGVGESGKDRLYIDWRRRPDAPDPATVANIQLHNQLAFPQLFRWGRLYSLPQALSSRYEHLQRLNYSIYPYHNNPHQHNHYHHQPHHQQAIAGYGNAAARYYIRSSEPHQIGPVQEGGGVPPPLVIDSVPVVHGKVAAKRLRLFGVNMECPPEDGSSPTITHNTMDSVLSSHLPSSSLSPLQLRLPGTTHLSSMQADYSDKGKSSLPFDLDL